MSAWSVKSRRALSRQCRDARVYGHTTTAILDNEYTPPPSYGRTTTSIPPIPDLRKAYEKGSILDHTLDIISLHIAAAYTRTGMV